MKVPKNLDELSHSTSVGWVKFMRFVEASWFSIVFRVVVLLALNVGAYLFVEWLNDGAYKRFKIFILLANMVILLVFLPSLHVTRSSARLAARSAAAAGSTMFAKNYVIVVAISIMILLLLAMSVYFIPYFFLTTETNVNKSQKFVYIFLIVFIYSMLFLSYGDYLMRLYRKIQNIPFIPSKNVLEAVANMVKFAVLYLLICLPIDVFKLSKSVVLGRFGVLGVAVLVAVVLVFLFLILYGGKIKDGTFKLNKALTVLRKDEVYLTHQTNLGFYDDVIVWDFESDDVMKETAGGKDLAILKPGDLEPVLSDEELNGAHVSILNGWWGENVTVPKTVRQFVGGEIELEDVFERAKRYLHDDVYLNIKAWLVLPEERPAVERDYVVEGLCDRESVMREIASGEDGESATARELEWERPSIPPPPDDSDRKRYKLLRMGERVHRINYSLSLWFYIAPLTENYRHEMNILNFSNKVVVSLGTDGTTIYVDVDSRLNERQSRHDKNPNLAKNKVKGRVAKRVFALDTFAHQRWNHLTLTTDHEGRMNAFMNGVLVATNDDVRPDLGPNNHMIYMGEKGGAKGMVKAVYYYNKVLTKTDVGLLYNKMHVAV